MVRWCGHSYFVVEALGHTIALDPHDGDSLNLPRCGVQADLVLVTHDHYDHNAVEVASGPGAAVVRWREGAVNVGWAVVRGVRLSHDERGGALFGHVVAYVVEVEGLRLAHLGDVGEPSSSAARVGKVDVVIVPAGDVTTVSQGEAIRWAEALGARLVIPAHYWVPGSNVPLDPLDAFLAAWRGRVLRPGLSYIEVKGSDMPTEQTLVILEPPSRGPYNDSRLP
ncbi:MAG: MBL fold metallo-hydrolase [Acidilobus sp.]